MSSNDHKAMYFTDDQSKKSKCQAPFVKKRKEKKKRVYVKQVFGMVKYRRETNHK